MIAGYNLDSPPVDVQGKALSKIHKAARYTAKISTEDIGIKFNDSVAVI